MFTDFYSWCTSLSDKIQNGGENSEYVDYYSAYFENTSVCSSIFWVAMGIALVVAAIYYFGICNSVYSLAKRWIWGCVLVLVFLATMFTTIPMIVGNDSENAEDATGIFATAYSQEQEKLDLTEDSEQREEIMQIASDFREQFKQKEDSMLMAEDLPMEMAAINGVYAIIVFFILSIMFKRFTHHGSAIPF